MNGEMSVLGACFLILITFLYSAIGVIIGRRLPYPASIAAYGAAIAAWLAFPLLAEAHLHRLDHLIGVVGFGLLVVHIAFMLLFSCLLLAVVFVTERWSGRHRLAIGGSVILTGDLRVLLADR